MFTPMWRNVSCDLQMDILNDCTEVEEGFMSTSYFLRSKNTKRHSIGTNKANLQDIDLGGGCPVFVKIPILDNCCDCTSSLSVDGLCDENNYASMTMSCC